MGMRLRLALIKGANGAPDTWRHTLDGKQVNNDDTVQLCKPDGTRLLGRYRWTAELTKSPTLSVIASGKESVVDLPADSSLEWPGTK